jgi:hypothetical protein
MHVRAPHGRIAFGLGRSLATGPAGLAVDSPTILSAASLLGRRPLLGGRCWGRRPLLGGRGCELDNALLRNGGVPQRMSLPLRCWGGGRLVGAWFSRRLPQSRRRLSRAAQGWVHRAAGPPVCICILTVCRFQAQKR